METNQPAASTPEASATPSPAHQVFNEPPPAQPSGAPDGTQPQAAPTPAEGTPTAGATPPAATPAAPVQPSPPAAPAVQSSEQLAEAIGTALAKHFPTAQPTGQPAAPVGQPQTPEQIAEAKKQFNVWEPSEDWTAKLYKGGKDALEAAIEMRDGLMKQSATMSWYQANLIRNELLKNFEPVMTAEAQRTEAEVQKNFYEKFPHLNAYKKLVDQVTANLNAQTFRAKTRDEAFEKIAGTVVEILKDAGIEVKQAAPASGAGTPNGAKPAAQQPTAGAQRPAGRMASVSSGGQGGAGGQPASPQLSDAHKVFAMPR